MSPGTLSLTCAFPIGLIKPAVLQKYWIPPLRWTTCSVRTRPSGLSHHYVTRAHCLRATGPPPIRCPATPDVYSPLGSGSRSSRGCSKLPWDTVLAFVTCSRSFVPALMGHECTSCSSARTNVCKGWRVGRAGTASPVSSLPSCVPGRRSYACLMNEQTVAPSDVPSPGREGERLALALLLQLRALGRELKHRASHSHQRLSCRSC